MVEEWLRIRMFAFNITVWRWWRWCSRCLRAKLNAHLISQGSQTRVCFQLLQATRLPLKRHIWRGWIFLGCNQIWWWWCPSWFAWLWHGWHWHGWVWKQREVSQQRIDVSNSTRGGGRCVHVIESNSYQPAHYIMSAYCSIMRCYSYQ